MKVASFEQREWIDPWRDRRPMTDDLVLAVCIDKDGEEYFDLAFFAIASGEWKCNDAFMVCEKVLWWMPLPDYPTKEVE